MEPQHNKSVDSDSVISFWSGAKYPYYKMSNFFQVPVRYLGVDYPCSENAFQAQLFPNAIDLFCCDGVLGSLTVEAFLFLGYSQEEAEKKCKHWSKKNMVGILSKMYANRHVSMKKNISEQECKTVFLDILYAKYTQNPELSKLLISTGKKYLLEYDKGANRTWLKHNKKVRWAGMIVNNKVVGDNQQGFLHMLTRQTLNGSY